MIGGGVIGILTAFFLTKAGMKVGLIEKGVIASGTSSKTMSNLSLHNRMPGPEWDLAMETLKIYKGDKIVVYTRSGETAFIVSEVLEKGGLAGGGRHPYILLNLESLQRLLNKEGKITNILVSNTGGTDESLDRSESVTRFLRSELTNTQVATEIFNILRSSEMPELLLGEARFVQATDPDASELLKRLSKKLDSERFDDEFIDCLLYTSDAADE